MPGIHQLAKLLACEPLPTWAGALYLAFLKTWILEIKLLFLCLQAKHFSQPTYKTLRSEIGAGEMALWL
ncbi:hypothetical protein I79_003873 [Cricetulus griseus]|uniref:Uncharacterized protein n=1 Tax=Cricetulus griseus TaxID=10029 RepID=G3H149_CRIGR|nr:hypothetical protein I79_003873 [Cricetulus griseus]